MSYASDACVDSVDWHEEKPLQPFIFKGREAVRSFGSRVLLASGLAIKQLVASLARFLGTFKKMLPLNEAAFC